MLPNYSIYFDGTNIASLADVSVYNWAVNSLPARQLTINKIAYDDLSLLSRAEYSTKELVIYVSIDSVNRTTAEQAFLGLKAALQGANKSMTVPQYGTNVNYTATLYSIDDKWDTGDVGHADVTIIFTATDPVGADNTPTTLITGSTITVQSTDVSATIGGSYFAKPTFTVIVGSVTGGTNASITIRNSATGQGITVTRTWTAGDTLSIDSLNQIVTVNGALSDFTGGFPKFTVGSIAVGYLDTFATRSVTLSASYYKKYI